MTALKHAEVIKHMVEHGFESVEGLFHAGWGRATQWVNPTSVPSMQWRIKPKTLRINVEIPMPDGFDEWFLAIGNGAVFYKSKEDRDEAERIIFNALRGGV
jgi:hypothetical protein